MLVDDDVGLGKTATGTGVLLDPAALAAVVVTLTHLPRQWEALIATKGRAYDLEERLESTPDVLILN